MEGYLCMSWSSYTPRSKQQTGWEKQTRRLVGQRMNLQQKAPSSSGRNRRSRNVNCILINQRVLVIFRQTNVRGGNMSGWICRLCFKLSLDHYTKKCLYLSTPHVLYSVLKAGYTLGNCQRPVSSLGVSQHMQK